ncbi:hypothetical protein PR001_g24390 [Phytophthora rubi]|uniref:Uncharacterized protein n=1 Tax=Phytophthora rubi TaxID=129364 RepID=A0A6A3IJV2_9STRA|nr:hypothetical protein PR001_g24390 [Phytophthora rubi]
MNDADVADADAVSCQCYGYAPTNDNGGCGGITREDKYCGGGDTTTYDTCMTKFSEWAENSRKQLAVKAKASTASHSHYETHDFSASLSVHFVESGDGGYMKKEFASTIPDSQLNTSRRGGPTRATSRVLNGDLECLYKK